MSLIVNLNGHILIVVDNRRSIQNTALNSNHFFPQRYAKRFLLESASEEPCNLRDTHQSRVVVKLKNIEGILGDRRFYLFRIASGMEDHCRALCRVKPFLSHLARENSAHFRGHEGWKLSVAHIDDRVSIIPKGSVLYIMLETAEDDPTLDGPTLFVPVFGNGVEFFIPLMVKSGLSWPTVRMRKSKDGAKCPNRLFFFIF